MVVGYLMVASKLEIFPLVRGSPMGLLTGQLPWQLMVQLTWRLIGRPTGYLTVRWPAPSVA